MCAFAAVNSLRRSHLRWGAVSAVFADPLGVVDFGTVEDGDVVVAAVVVSLHVKLLKLHFDNLEEAGKQKGRQLTGAVGGSTEEF